MDQGNAELAEGADETVRDAARVAGTDCVTVKTDRGTVGTGASGKTKRVTAGLA